MSHWKTVAIYGVGLIGGSIGLALRKHSSVERLVGLGRNADRLRTAVQCGAIDTYSIEVESMDPPELVVLCTPVQLLASHCAQISEAFPGAIITDAGSTKRTLVDQIETNSPQANFVGSHPLAGSEKTGVTNAKADLFVGKHVVLTPTKNSSERSVSIVRRFWESMSAQTSIMSASEHDAALASTSHLPHVVSSALAAETPVSMSHLVAGGWRDMTRIAAADIELWTQIIQENQQNVLSTLRSLQARLRDFESAIEQNDKDSIERLLKDGKQRRDAMAS